jgi:uncharacterized protein
MRTEYKETIVVRKDLDFGLSSDDTPKYWMHGDPYKTRVMDAVQATFPDGERYFITSVRAFRDQIKDPELLQAVKDFSMQEGQHGMVHTRYNQRLGRQGIPIDSFTEHTQQITEWRLKHLSAKYNVAMTAAFEHFTAMMAELFFAEKAVLKGADERMRALFAWHAVEEMEHKAVAFDVMQKVAHVGYFTRVLAMTHAAAAFSLYILIAPWFMLRADGMSRWQRIKAYAKGASWQLSPRSGVFLRLLPMLATYYRPGFHPNHQKTVHNYDAWIKAYAADQDPMVASEAMYAAAY